MRFRGRGKRVVLGVALRAAAAAVRASRGGAAALQLVPGRLHSSLGCSGEAAEYLPGTYYSSLERELEGRASQA